MAGLLAAALTAWAAPAAAQISDAMVKIGVMGDMTSFYADIAGPGSVVAARMAAEDFGGTVLGKPIVIVAGDHQNKPDIGSAIARAWYDAEQVDAIADVPNSGVGIAVHEITREKKKVLLGSGTSLTDLTGSKCSPNSVIWTFDTWSLANGTGRALMEAGGRTWAFVTADYAFGHQLERDTARVVQDGGGQVLATIRHPLNTPDFASFLLRAQGTGAQVIALANAGADMANAVKQASEFGIEQKGQRLAALVAFITDVHALGLKAAQGLLLTEAFYWDLNDGTRAWSRRFAERNGGKYPTMVQAGVYAAVLHYLKAIEAAKTDDGTTVVEAMKAMPSNDPLFGEGRVRADGRHIHPMYLFQVKKPSESAAPYDYYKLVGSIPADKAFRPMGEGDCYLVK
ncbi:ABC transporter substrate-binding protein [Chelatococcus reniformis]|uniref:ABC transporter substrate-binding protein n=2 Tax=Chelatococcus reniformis TaxID=1494448 RepID=A0A916U090_9HYPH|nr:ABC transporter substrate-binding protein [Chelatococcus reniformis]